MAGTLGMPPWLAKGPSPGPRKADRETLERALYVFADLESACAAAASPLDEDTAFSLALARATA